jgi:hypothetical protein
LEWAEARSFTPSQRATVAKVYDELCSGNPVAALENTTRLSGEHNAGTALRMAVCREVAAYLGWTDWALAYAAEKDLQRHDTALRGLALAAAVQGLWDADSGALSLAKRISDPFVSASTFRDLAEFSARTGRVEDVLKRAKDLMYSREKDRVLHRISRALAQRYRQAVTVPEKARIRGALISLIPSCAEFYGATYLALARLVEVEPKSCQVVAEALQRRGLIMS